MTSLTLPKVPEVPIGLVVVVGVRRAVGPQRGLSLKSTKGATQLLEIDEADHQRLKEPEAAKGLGERVPQALLMLNLVNGTLGRVATTRTANFGIPRLAENGRKGNVREVMLVCFPIVILTLMPQQPEETVKALIGQRVRPARVLVAKAVKGVVVAIAGLLLAPFTV